MNASLVDVTNHFYHSFVYNNILARSNCGVIIYEFSKEKDCSLYSDDSLCYFKYEDSRYLSFIGDVAIDYQNNLAVCCDVEPIGHDGTDGGSWYN